jgi:hypothetical protein
MDAYCDVAGDGSVHCLPRVCAPNQARCVDRGGASAVCDARGSDESVVDCPDGCDFASGRCSGPSTGDCDFVPEVTEGTTFFDLCEEDEDYEPQSGPQCGSTNADAGDRMVRLVLTERRRVLIELRDQDGEVGVDTILYVRNSCGEGAAQLACSDDIRCDTSSIDFGCSSSGNQVRESRLVLDLEPGEYFIVADAFDYSTGGGGSFTCGFVRLLVEFI